MASDAPMETSRCVFFFFKAATNALVASIPPPACYGENQRRRSPPGWCELILRAIVLYLTRYVYTSKNLFFHVRSSSGCGNRGEAGGGRGMLRLQGGLHLIRFLVHHCFVAYKSALFTPSSSTRRSFCRQKHRRVSSSSSTCIPHPNNDPEK